MRQSREPFFNPRRILTETGRSTASAIAATMRHARSGSSSSVAPAPVFVTFLTGQPKLTSTMSAPAAATIFAASAIVSGFEPKSWIASGCSSEATRRYPSVFSLRCSIPAQETISEQTSPAPNRRPCRLNACTLTPAIGARTRRVGTSTVPIRQLWRRPDRPVGNRSHGTNGRCRLRVRRRGSYPSRPS